jgi:methanogenic corrinoid protein MtbC1
MHITPIALARAKRCENVTREDLLRKARDAISRGDQESGLAIVKLSIEEGVDVKDILMEILIAWQEISEFYNRSKASEYDEKEIIRVVGKIYVPTYIILFHLEKAIPEASNPLGCVVVGCMSPMTLVKDIIALLFKASGYKVIYKLGFGGETPNSLIESIKTVNADALLLSVSQPTNLPMISETIIALKREGIRDKVLVVIGGWAVTMEISRTLGCDVYGDHPLKGLKAVEHFIKSRKRSSLNFR